MSSTLLWFEENRRWKHDIPFFRITSHLTSWSCEVLKFPTGCRWSPKWWLPWEMAAVQAAPSVPLQPWVHRDMMRWPRMRCQKCKSSFAGGEVGNQNGLGWVLLLLLLLLVLLFLLVLLVVVVVVVVVSAFFFWNPWFDSRSPTSSPAEQLEHARLVAQLLLRFLNSSKGSIPDAAVARLCAVPLGCRGDLDVKEILLEGGFDVESDRSTFRKSRLMVIFHFLPKGSVFESRTTRPEPQSGCSTQVVQWTVSWGLSNVPSWLCNTLWRAKFLRNGFQLLCVLWTGLRKGLGSVGNLQGCTILLMEIITCFQWKGNIYGPKKVLVIRSYSWVFFRTWSWINRRQLQQWRTSPLSWPNTVAKRLMLHTDLQTRPWWCWWGDVAPTLWWGNFPAPRSFPRTHSRFFFQKVKESMLPHIRP